MRLFWMMHDLCESIFDALDICDIYYQQKQQQIWFNKYDTFEGT